VTCGGCAEFRIVLWHTSNPLLTARRNPRKRLPPFGGLKFGSLYNLLTERYTTSLLFSAWRLCIFIRHSAMHTCILSLPPSQPISRIHSFTKLFSTSPHLTHDSLLSAINYLFSFTKMCTVHASWISYSYCYCYSCPLSIRFRNAPAPPPHPRRVHCALRCAFHGRRSCPHATNAKNTPKSAEESDQGMSRIRVATGTKLAKGVSFGWLLSRNAYRRPG